MVKSDSGGLGEVVCVWFGCSRNLEDTLRKAARFLTGIDGPSSELAPVLIRGSRDQIKSNSDDICPRDSFVSQAL